MGRKTKLKISRIWSFVSSPHTIKEVCTTAVFNNTEREKRTKIVLASIGATVFFFLRSLFFLKWRLGKNICQEERQKHKEGTPPIDREAKRVQVHDGENKRRRDRVGEGKREHDREESR